MLTTRRAGSKRTFCGRGDSFRSSSVSEKNKALVPDCSIQNVKKKKHDPNLCIHPPKEISLKHPRARAHTAWQQPHPATAPWGSPTDQRSLGPRRRRSLSRTLHFAPTPGYGCGHKPPVDSFLGCHSSSDSMVQHREQGKHGQTQPFWRVDSQLFLPTLDSCIVTSCNQLQSIVFCQKNIQCTSLSFLQLCWKQILKDQKLGAN